MKKSIKIQASFIGMLASASVASADYTLLEQGYDFAAPAAHSVSDISNKVLGAIVFETSTGTFKGYAGGNDWLQLSLPGGSPVSSSKTGTKIEFAAMSAICTVNGACALSSDRTSQNISITRTGTGLYTVNLDNGVFTYAPICTISVVNGSSSPTAWPTSPGTAPTSTAYKTAIAWFSGGTLNATDAQIEVMCIGT